MSADELAIGITFLTGRYHGAEWPPSPARLYQALIAGLMTGGYRRHFTTVEPALRWLEQRDAPTIAACDARPAGRYRIAVPNNDLDRAGLKWAAGREANIAQFRTLKAIDPCVLSGDGPHVVYRWRAKPEEIRDWSEPLQTAAHCLHTFGWGVDMAFADVVSGDAVQGAVHYSPSDHGSVDLTVPIAGTLDDLRTTYQHFVARTSGAGVYTHTRPSVIDTRRYARDKVRRSAVAAFRLRDAQAEKTRSVPWAHGMKVAAWVRHQAACALVELGWSSDRIATYIQGHTAEGEKSRRLSYVPLPNISPPYPDGRVRRVIIVEPPSEPGSAVRELRRALSACVLTDEKGEDVACLEPAEESSDANFKRYLGPKESSTWRSVTPVVLHGYNVKRRGVIDIDKTEKLLLRAFEMAGHPANTISGLTFQTGPLWPGTGHASVMLLPEHLSKYPRLHVEVTFKQPVAGPILAGIGRHYGIGLFARID